MKLDPLVLFELFMLLLDLTKVVVVEPSFSSQSTSKSR